MRQGGLDNTPGSSPRVWGQALPPQLKVQGPLVVPVEAILCYLALLILVILFACPLLPFTSASQPVQTERQLNWHELIKPPSNNGLLTGLVVQINVAGDRQARWPC